MISDLLGWVSGVSLLAGLAFAFLGVTGRAENGTEYFYGLLSLANVGDFIRDALQRDRFWTLLAAFFAAFFAWAWWQQRRKRKDKRRLAEALGYKSRAILAAITRRAREASQPRPRLIPLPESGF